MAWAQAALAADADSADAGTRDASSYAQEPRPELVAEAGAPDTSIIGTRSAPGPAAVDAGSLAAGPDALAAVVDAPGAEAPSPQAPAGADFVAEARLLTRLAACVGDGVLPSAWPALGVRAHCDSLQVLVERYRRRWIAPTQSYLSKLVPGDLPKRVVYPFGGGDLFTALHAFPSAEEYTTISLEDAGDIRGLARLDWADVEDSLASTRQHLRSLFAVSHSKTTNLRAGTRAALPGEITFALIAFTIFDYEPVSLRYFRLDGHGDIVYLSADELDATDRGIDPVANVEIAFRARREPQAPMRVYRHIAANLDDNHFVANQPLALHLRAKGRVSVLIKAASYLLWFDSFSHVRSYLLDQAEWMLSDSTGVQPSLARAAGFEQECWGFFHGPFIAQYARAKSEVVALWQQGPRRELPFYFGYPDVDGHGHMMITRRTGRPPQTGTERPVTDRVSGGAHWRLVTGKGPVHVWQPSGYDAASAGTVVYVHGYYATADAAWVEHALAEQFAASKLNALFIVPEAPTGGSAEVAWPVLSELLAEVERQLPGIHASSPIVAAGHSGAWRTLGAWTEEASPERRVASFILLDGLYGMADKFHSWLAQQDGDEPRLTLVSRDTASHAEGFLAGLTGARRRARLPARYRDLSPAEKTAPVLEIGSQLGHMEIVTSGRVLPVVLRRSPLHALAGPAKGTKNKASKEPGP